ncbi:MAG: DUF4238 domain-containing protein [Bacteroidaceae bacterium]|nr:DUF4238 domain-containing protein [Bacteroidaceae bacterium]
MRRKKTRQHFVPQCYLRYFYRGNNEPCAFDKVEMGSHPTTLDSICIEKFMYDIAPEFSCLEDGSSKQTILEDDFFDHIIERGYSKLLGEINDSLLSIVNAGFFPDVLREKLAFYLVVQFLRMPTVKKETQQFCDDVLPKLSEIFKEGLAIESGNQDFVKLSVIPKYDASRMHFKYNYGNEEILSLFTHAILINRWIFLYSPDGDFYTSDNPCVVIQHTNFRPFCMGLAQYGSEIIFPISPYLSVIIYDRKYYKELDVPDNSVNIANFEHIAHVNLNIYVHAKRFVLSKKCDFNIIEQYNNENGKDENANHECGG